MRLVKKIPFKRVKDLTQFKAIESKFKEIHSQHKNSGIARVESISKLNFFIVLEYINVTDRIDYSKIFPNDNYVVDFEALMNEQDRVINYIGKRKNNYPETFKKLGITHEVVGCFLIATRKANIISTSVKNTMNTISLKLDTNNLPTEIDNMCDEFYKNKREVIIKEQEEFEKFLKLSFEEQDIILQNILQNIKFPPMSNTGDSKQQHINNNKTMNNYTVTKMEDVANENISNISSVEFLKSFLAISENKENYELCAKIRDRISYLTGNF